MSSGTGTETGDRDRERVREHALSLGFSACGFTSAEPLTCGPLLEDWLARGRHGLLDYLGRGLDRRTSPAAFLENAASVIVAAWPYTPPPPAPCDWRQELRGRIAGYALGSDYHDELAAKLNELADVVSASGGGAWKTHVDGGPLVEKDLARRAGIGWYGRNTNILARSPRPGSYFLLALLITEAHFEPDPPFEEEHCGSCTACIPACPTGALDTGPTIDAPRCISYLTIEHRGPVDPELRPLIGNWVFGCDICQEVCPWNEDDAPPCEELTPALPDLLMLDEDAFRERYRHTALSRAKRRGLARNAAIVLGNTGNPAAVDPLARALREHDAALVRAHAAWGLGELGGREARRALEAAQGAGDVPPVVAEIERALGGQGRS